MIMTTLRIPSEHPVLDNVETPAVELPRQQRRHEFDLDDAFSVQDDAVTTFDFKSDSSLKQLRPGVGAQKDRANVEDTHDSMQARYDPMDASVSTFDTDSIVAPHRTSEHEPPPPSSSSHSLNSEEQPPTPPDNSPASTAHISQFTNIVLSASLNPTHAIHDVEQHGYPNVVIDASKMPPTPGLNFPSSGSQRTQTSHTSSRSSTSEYATGLVESASRSGSPQGRQSVSTSPVSPVPTASKVAKQGTPSVFQRVVSRTRPPHLPPKEKDEDDRHSKEWEEMMERSRITEQKRREALEARRLARELSLDANAELWRHAILPDWKKAVRDPHLRKIWWDGVPTKLRSIVWERAVGNALALSRDAYPSTLARAKNLLATQRFPSEVLSQLYRDLSRTLPELRIFHHLTGPLYGDLRDMLCAWIVSRADEGLGYVEGIARIGAMLLLNLNGPAQAFIVMRNLLNTSCLRAFYGGMRARDDVEAYYRIFDTLLADGMPKVYFNFKQHRISPASYLPDWLLPLFLDHLPLEPCSRIWDAFLLEGDAFLFRAALATLACLESRLFYPDRAELIAVLKGESSAALQVALRSRSQSLSINQSGIIGPRYEIYGINEETVWERVVEMQDWFKDSTWQRLIQRELPDL